MPLVKRWHVPRGLRPTLTGRKVRTTLMSRVERQQRGNVAPRPLWFDAALAHPPPPKFQLDRPPDLAFPEDELRREWLRRNPAATMVPKALFLEEASVPDELRRHPADAFVERQMELIEEGTAPEEAYRIVAAEQEREGDVRALEERTARGVAAALGAEPADGGDESEMRGQTLLLRRFAEEARDMGLPYPRHWFHPDGSWKGVGARALRASLAARTRRALDRSTADAAGGVANGADDAVLSMLGEEGGGGKGGGGDATGGRGGGRRGGRGGA